jgi:hypothetical protein
MSEITPAVEIIRARALYREHAKSLDDALARAGQEIAIVLDNLSEDGKKLYTKDFKDRTGFPNLTEVSKRIEQHAVQSLTAAANETGVEVLYSGYDNSCSVGRSVALPGSDLDGWSILIRGTKEDKQRLFRSITDKLDPAVFDLWSLDIERIISEDELKSLSRYGRADLGQVRASAAACAGILLETLREGRVLLNNLGSIESWIKESRLYRESNFLHKDLPGNNSTKLKHQARENLKEFDRLTEEEQFIIVRIIQQVNEGIPIDLNLSN